MHCFLFGPFGSHRGLVTGMQLLAACATERELQEKWKQEEIAKSYPSSAQSEKTAPLKRSW